MALPSFFKRKPKTAARASSPDPLGDDSGPVQAARTRARRRLIGAVVLLAVGVLVFPMLFETKPRPLPDGIPIELPKRDGAPARVAVAPRLTPPSVTEVAPPEPVTPPASAASPAAEPAPAEPSRPLPTAEPRPIDIPPSAMGPASAAPRAASRPEPRPEPRAASKPTAGKLDVSKADSPKPDSPKPAKPEADKPRPDADKPKTAADTRHAASGTVGTEPRAGRFVVQVGAYTDNATLQEVRAKVEKLGLKTYTQSVETPAGRRTRVRVGPFENKAEADSASSKLKAAGLPGNVLSL